MRQTKIICTLGPVSSNIETLTKLAERGMNVARFNFSHGSPEEQLPKINMVREINKTREDKVGLLLDTKGPEIRTHLFPEGKVSVKKGSTVTICMEEVAGNAERFSVTYPGLINDVKEGGTILVDDGYLELTIKSIDKAKGEITTVAENTHSIKDRRGINVPNCVLNMPFISEKDKVDMTFAATEGMDFIAASFVRRADDVKQIREILKAAGNESVKIISKIENQEGVDNIDEIIEISDGVMVARGDLGVEVPAEDVPGIQKYITRRCQSLGKIVVVATQMLESMQQNPRPTRAEVSDVANAVLDGACATMLSGESAAGEYPVESVTYMAKIDEKAEKDINYKGFFDRAMEAYCGSSISKAICTSVTHASMEYNIEAIILEDDPSLIKNINQFRPKAVTFVAVKDEDAARKYSLNWGTFARVATVDELAKHAVESLNLQPRDKMVIIDRRNIKYLRAEDVK